MHIRRILLPVLALFVLYFSDTAFAQVSERSIPAVILVHCIEPNETIAVTFPLDTTHRSLNAILGNQLIEVPTVDIADPVFVCDAEPQTYLDYFKADGTGNDTIDGD